MDGDKKDTKLKEIHSYFSHLKLDIAGITECNVMWKNVPAHCRLHEVTIGWWESLHINAAYFQQCQTALKSLAGGVAVLSINKGAHRVMEQGQDPKGLGRWAWTKYRGQQGVSLRVVVAYRPVLNKSGVLSVWNQQKVFFESKDEDRCPREMFVEDLCAEVVKWLAEGDQLVIGVDANEDVRSSTFGKRLKSLGLEETITAQHGSDGPATYNRGS